MSEIYNIILDLSKHFNTIEVSYSSINCFANNMIKLFKSNFLIFIEIYLIYESKMLNIVLLNDDLNIKLSLLQIFFTVFKNENEEFYPYIYYEKAINKLISLFNTLSYNDDSNSLILKKRLKEIIYSLTSPSPSLVNILFEILNFLIENNNENNDALHIVEEVIYNNIYYNKNSICMSFYIFDIEFFLPIIKYSVYNKDFCIKILVEVSKYINIKNLFSGHIENKNTWDTLNSLIS